MKIKKNNIGLIKQALPLDQGGYSLIELLIAMMIGLFLLLGIGSAYLNSIKGQITRDQYSLLQDNARLVLDSMTKVIEHTGYQADRIMLEDKFITGAVPNNACIANNTLLNSAFGTTRDDDTGNRFTGDRIGIVYLGSTKFNSDCGGVVNALPACQVGHQAFKKSGNTVDLARIYNAFYIDNTDGHGELKCIGSLAKGEHIIADNIENMQITYGIDTNGDGVVNRYADATSIASGDWNTPISVQIAVLVKSKKKVKNQAEKKSYDLLGIVITPPKDKFYRAVFKTTVWLRNNT